MFLMSLFFLVFILFIGFVLFNQPLYRLIRAKEEYLPSAKASLIFAYPLTVKADGQSISNINVFVRSSTGIPVANKSVSLITSLGQINPPMNTTNKEGKVSFKLTSASEGTASVQALVDGSPPLEQKISVLFKNEDENK